MLLYLYFLHPGGTPRGPASPPQHDIYPDRGGSSISETQYYYHTIEPAFPIIRRYDTVAQRIIPEVVTNE